MTRLVRNALPAVARGLQIGVELGGALGERGPVGAKEGERQGRNGQTLRSPNRLVSN
jgi:hypothetical protein